MTEDLVQCATCIALGIVPGDHCGYDPEREIENIYGEHDCPYHKFTLGGE